MKNLENQENLKRAKKNDNEKKQNAKLLSSQCCYFRNTVFDQNSSFILKSRRGTTNMTDKQTYEHKKSCV